MDSVMLLVNERKLKRYIITLINKTAVHLTKIILFYQETGSKEYINLQYITYLNEVYTCLLGWIAFLGSLKFLKLLRFNRRVGFFTATLRFAMMELLQFGIMFIIAFLGFANVFYFTFCGSLIDYATYITTMETLLTTMLNRFHFLGIWSCCITV